MHGHIRWEPLRLNSLRVRALLRYAVAASLLVLAAGILLTPPARPADCQDIRRATAGRPDSAAAVSRRPGSGRTPSLPPGTAGVAVQLAEPATISAVRPGDRVDLVSRAATADDRQARTDPPPGDGPVLARNALVISVTAPAHGVVYLALPPEQAHRLSRIAPGVAVGLIVRSG